MSGSVGPASAPQGEAKCPACGAPPSPGRWCLACGAAFDAAPGDAAQAPPSGGTVEAKKYSCEGCGALMLWDAEHGALKCPFCGGATAVERSDDYVAVEYDLEHVPPESLRAEAPKVFKCEDCGAEVAFEGTTVASVCAFCGAAHVVERRGEAGRIRPESLLPFVVSKEKALEGWRKWLGKGIFRPKALKTAAGEEKLRGVYQPYWTFDADAWSRWTAEAGYHYTVRVPDGRGGTRSETRTRWVPAAGQRQDSYDDLLVLAGTGLEERLAQGVYPYRLNELQPYASAYLSGWLAEEYTVGAKEGWNRARDRINEEQVRRCGRDVPGDTQRNLRVWTQHGNVKWKHLLLPLWIATYRYREKTYRFLVNGQTGKVHGTKPISWVRVAIAVALGLGLAAAAYFLFRK